MPHCDAALYASQESAQRNFNYLLNNIALTQARYLIKMVYFSIEATYLQRTPHIPGADSYKRIMVADKAA